MPIIGTQIYGLTKELSADMERTLRSLHEAGFQALEPLLLFVEKQDRYPKNMWSLETLSQTLSLLKELEMRIPSVHIGIGSGDYIMPVDTVVEGILNVKENFGIDSFVISGMFQSFGETKRWGELIGKINRSVSPYGCTVIYHNHDTEFRQITVRGQQREAMDYFFELAGDDIMLELDIGWAGVGGDECIIFDKYRDRISLLHLKDFFPGYESGYERDDLPEEAFAPIGAGIIKTEEIVRACRLLPNFKNVFIIDQDKYAGDMMEALKAGFNHISRLLAEDEV